MPALPVIADVYRCALHWTNSSGGDAVNVIHVKAASQVSTVLIFNVLDAHVTAAMWDWVAATAVVDDVAVTPLDGVTGTDHFSTGSPAKWTGGGLGQALPQVAGIIKLTTGFRGRSHRGRIFIPFIGEGETATGTLIDVAAVQAAWSAFEDAVELDGTTPVTMGVASYKLGTFTATSSVFAEPKTATQRRRMSRLR